MHTVKGLNSNGEMNSMAKEILNWNPVNLWINVNSRDMHEFNK